MEPKKTPKADLSRRSLLFFSLGLTISLSLVVAAFEFETLGDEITGDHGTVIDTFNPPIYIPPTEIKPPKPPKLVHPKIVEFKNDAKVKDDILPDFDLSPDTLVESVVIKPVEPEATPDYFLVVEDAPTPKGGMQAFYTYIGKHLHYPTQARRMSVEGRVFVQFIVEKDGSLTDVKAIKGIGAGCDEEAVRVVESAPPWNPGKQRGQPVRVRMVLPIVFKLTN